MIKNDPSKYKRVGDVQAEIRKEYLEKRKENGRTMSEDSGTGNATQQTVVALAAEMMKVSDQVGELEDPFAAWETIDLIKSQNDQLRKALVKADQFITNGIDLGYIHMPDPGSNDSALLTPGIIRAALAATTEGSEQ